MFRTVCDPSSGSVERASLKLLVIFFACVVGVWQSDFEPAVCVPGTRHTHTPQVESSALHLHTVRLFTESDDTRGFSNKICPPEDEHGAARNMLRIVM